MNNINIKIRIAVAVGLVHVPGEMRLGVFDAVPRPDPRA